MTDMDPLLERIDRTLSECDARALPPLTSGTAAAAIDAAEQAGAQLAAAGVSVADCRAPDLGGVMCDLVPPRADPRVWPEPTMVKPRPEQARGWLARWINRAVGR